MRAELGRVAGLWPDIEKTLDTIGRAIEDGKGKPRDMSDIGARAGLRASPATARRDAPPAPGNANDNPSFHAEPGGAQSGEGFGGDFNVPPDTDRDRHCASLPQTDLGNAERFFYRYGTDFRFCPDLGWLKWDGRRWHALTEEKDKTPGEVMQAVFATVCAIRHEEELVAQSGCKEDAPEDASDAERPRGSISSSRRRAAVSRSFPIPFARMPRPARAKGGLRP